MKKLGIIGGVLISAALIVGSAGATLADTGSATPTPQATAPAGQQSHGVFGTVAEISGDVITLDSKALGEIEVTLSADTIYIVPGQDTASKDDIKTGSRLAILATSGTGEYTAVRVMVVPGTPTGAHVNGVIVSIDNKVMTITNAAGETQTFDLPQGVKGGAVGEFVSAAVRKSPGGGNQVATGIETAANVQARLQSELNEATGRPASTDAQIQQKNKDVEELSQKLLDLAARQKAVLEKVLANAPESAAGAIQKAIDNSQKGLEQASQSVSKTPEVGS